MKKSDLGMVSNGVHGSVLNVFQESGESGVLSYLNDGKKESARIWSDGMRSIYLHADRTYSVREFSGSKLGFVTVANGLESWDIACNYGS